MKKYLLTLLVLFFFVPFAWAGSCISSLSVNGSGTVFPQIQDAVACELGGAAVQVDSLVDSGIIFAVIFVFLFCAVLFALFAYVVVSFVISLLPK